MMGRLNVEDIYIYIYTYMYVYVYIYIYECIIHTRT